MARTWAEIDKRPRRLAAELTASDIPQSNGIYVFYRDDTAAYLGKADSLRRRIWDNHLGKGAAMGSSALRRNVAEHLGISSSADIKTKRYRCTVADLALVSRWLADCEIAWLEGDSGESALIMERDLKAVFKPYLTKR